jgi:hypothetical protein
VRRCTVSIRGKDGELHSKTADATSFFDAAAMIKLRDAEVAESMDTFEDWLNRQEELDKQQERNVRNKENVERIVRVANASRSSVLMWIKLRVGTDRHNGISVEVSLERWAEKVEQDGFPFSN